MIWWIVYWLTNLSSALLSKHRIREELDIKWWSRSRCEGLSDREVTIVTNVPYWLSLDIVLFKLKNQTKLNPVAKLYFKNFYYLLQVVLLGDEKC